MAAKTFTFKTTEPTGRYRSFENANHDIKVGGKVVGSISDSPPYRIRLQVTKTDVNEDGKPNCPWMWITLKKQSESVKEAKEWLKTVFDSINQKYNLHQE